MSHSTLEFTHRVRCYKFAGHALGGSGASAAGAEHCRAQQRHGAIDCADARAPATVHVCHVCVWSQRLPQQRYALNLGHSGRPTPRSNFSGLCDWRARIVRSTHNPMSWGCCKYSCARALIFPTPNSISVVWPVWFERFCHRTCLPENVIEIDAAAPSADWADHLPNQTTLVLLVQSLLRSGGCIGRSCHNFLQ